MSFVDAVRSVYRNYATFDGRATRSEFWWFYLFIFLVVLGLFVIALALFAITRSSSVLGVAELMAVIFFLASVIPSIAVSVRRLHDSDKSGWWYLIGFVPYIGEIILLILLALPSTIGVNRYGAPYGGLPDDKRVQYSGPSRADAWVKFVADARDASAAGYHPVSQNWRPSVGGEAIEVVYRRRSLDPPWGRPLRPTRKTDPNQGPPSWS
jgi:uncharacterized membrane protein YhaH (DUF805 family)